MIVEVVVTVEVDVKVVRVCVAEVVAEVVVEVVVAEQKPHVVSQYPWSAQLGQNTEVQSSIKSAHVGMKSATW